MKKTKKSVKEIFFEKKLMFDVINVVLGIVVVALIILLFLFPNNLRLVAAAVGAGGAINCLNGYRQLSEGRNPMAGKSMVTTGAFLIVVGMILLFAL